MPSNASSGRPRPTGRPIGCQDGPRHFGLPQAQWPPDIQAGWRTYRAQCGLRLREAYLHGLCEAPDDLSGLSRQHLRSHPHLGRSSLTWRAWRSLCAGTGDGSGAHRAPMGGRGDDDRGHGQSAEASTRPRAGRLSQYAAEAAHPCMPSGALGVPGHLEAVAEVCLAEGRMPLVVHARASAPWAPGPAAFNGVCMLKLLVRIPLRQRNVREIRLGRPSLPGPAPATGSCIFAGPISRWGSVTGRSTSTTSISRTTAPEFIPVLEEFLQVHRPRLPGALRPPRSAS